MLKKYSKFFGKVWKINETAVITIPANIMKFGGYEIGDDIEVYIRKGKSGEE